MYTTKLTLPVGQYISLSEGEEFIQAFMKTPAFKHLADSHQGLRPLDLQLTFTSKLCYGPGYSRVGTGFLKVKIRGSKAKRQTCAAMLQHAWNIQLIDYGNRALAREGIELEPEYDNDIVRLNLSLTNTFYRPVFLPWRSRSRGHALGL